MSCDSSNSMRLGSFHTQCSIFRGVETAVWMRQIEPVGLVTSKISFLLGVSSVHTRFLAPRAEFDIDHNNAVATIRMSQNDRLIFAEVTFPCFHIFL